MKEQQLRPEDLPQDDFQRDLHPHTNAGINDSTRDDDSELNAGNAFDMTELHNELKDFTDDELRRIVVLPPGTVLKQGAIYLDLKAPDRSPFKVQSPITAGPNNAFVPKKETDYVLWNRLTGVDNPERLDENDVGA
jgi:hypothetical protein